MGTGVLVGSHLLAVRHQPVLTKADFAHIYLFDRRIWLRLRDPATIKRTLSSDSIRILELHKQWLQSISLVKCLRPKPLWTGECAADACTYSDITHGGSSDFGLHYGSVKNLPTTNFQSCKFQLSKCKNVLLHLKQWPRWPSCLLLANQPQVVAIPCEFHLLRTILAQKPLATDYGLWNHQWTCFWKNWHCNVHYQVWNWTFHIFLATEMKKPMLWVDGMANLLHHFNILWQIAFEYPFRNFGSLSLASHFILLTHIFPGHFQWRRSYPLFFCRNSTQIMEHLWCLNPYIW